MRLDIGELPQSGWRIYQEPKATYKGAEKVMAAVFAGESLRCKQVYKDTGEKYDINMYMREIKGVRILDWVITMYGVNYFPIDEINNNEWTAINE